MSEYHLHSQSTTQDAKAGSYSMPLSVPGRRRMPPKARSTRVLPSSPGRTRLNLKPDSCAGRHRLTLDELSRQLRRATWCQRIGATNQKSPNLFVIEVARLGGFLPSLGGSLLSFDPVHKIVPDSVPYL